jgi:Zn ribbon nucleic-acid-binding protein
MGVGWDWADVFPPPACPEDPVLCDWQPDDRLVMTCTSCGMADHKATRARRAVRDSQRG